MSAAAPLNLASLPAPPSPGQRDPGGVSLFSWQGQPYCLDGHGNLWALTPAVTVPAWAQAAAMAVPSGTPAAGAVPVAQDSTGRTAWSTGVLMDETGGLVS